MGQYTNIRLGSLFSLLQDSAGQGQGFEMEGGNFTFSNNFPKLNEIIPFALFSSGAPGSPVKKIRSHATNPTVKANSLGT